MNFDEARTNTWGCFGVTQSSSPFTSAALGLAGFSYALIYATANTGAGETITLEIEDSEDGSTFAATACPSISIPESSGLVAKSFHIRGESVRAYIRLKATLAGGAVLHGAGYMLSNNHQSASTAPDREY